MKVFVTGIWRRSANSFSSAAALLRVTPLPTSIIGFFACLIIDAALFIASGFGRGYSIPLLARGLPVASTPAMSSGTSMCVEPGFSSWAILNAFLTISGMTSGLSTRIFHFVAG